MKTTAAGTRSTEALAKAEVLTQALPWLSTFHGATVVVKFGGNAMVDEALQRAFAAGRRLPALRGPAPGRRARRRSADHRACSNASASSPSSRGGLRVTTPEAMDVVRMVLTGQVQREIVGLINAHGPFAVGLSGEDATPSSPQRRHVMVDGEAVDIGLVGDIVAVDAELVAGAARRRAYPGRLQHRPRPRTARSTTSTRTPPRPRWPSALGAEKLVVLTDVEGLYADWPAPHQVVSRARRRTSWSSCCRASPPAWSRRWRPACARYAAGSARRTCSTAASSTPCCSKCSRTRESERWWYRHEYAARRDRRRAARERRRQRAPQRIDAAVAEGLPVVHAQGGLSAEWTARYGNALMNTFGPPKRVFVRGEGAQVWDADGRRYLDLFAGIAVNSLGHAHPLIVNAVTAQLTTLGHVGNFFATAPQIALAERLVALTGADARGLLRQLGHRGQRGRVQADPADRPHQDRLHRGRLPRPHHGRARADRQAGHPRTLRAAARRGRIRALRRPRGTRGGPRRRDRRVLRRADPGRARRAARPARLPPRGPRTDAASRRAARARRGADRHRTHRRLVRLPAGRHRPGRADAGEGARRRAPIGACLAFGPANGPVRARLARHHLRRQPGGLRRRPRGAARDRARRPARPCPRGRRPVARGHRIARPPRGRRACAAPGCCSRSS